MDYILKFVSDAGEFPMGDGRHEYFRISNVRGLGFPEVERQTMVYSGRRGEKTVSARFLPRVITVSGDIVKKDALAEITSILAQEGVLYIKRGQEERKIAVIPCAAEDAERIGDITRLVFQLSADDPAFTEKNETRVGIYERVNLVMGSFTPPCVFTRRVEGGNLVNLGDVASEPVITVMCSASTPGETTVIIKNEDTGAKIELTRKFSAGDIITVNTKTAEITDKDGNSLLSTMSDDTYLSEFVLKRGNNNISVISSELGSQLTVICKYDKKYLEACL